MGDNQMGGLSPGALKNQHLDKGELDSYTFTAATGEGIALRVTDVAGGSLWPGFTVYGPAGNVVTWGSGVDVASASRSEEPRVGKEGRSRGPPYHYKKNVKD